MYIDFVKADSLYFALGRTNSINLRVENIDIFNIYFIIYFIMYFTTEYSLVSLEVSLPIYFFIRNGEYFFLLQSSL